MGEVMKKQNIECLSTHGAAGYCAGSYWDGFDIICGGCGYRIKNPPPSGSRTIYKKGLLGLFNKGHEISTWPEFILGKRGIPYE
jgi:hypothetical protein